MMHALAALELISTGFSELFGISICAVSISDCFMEKPFDFVFVRVGGGADI